MHAAGLHHQDLYLNHVLWKGDLAAADPARRDALAAKLRQFDAAQAKPAETTGTSSTATATASASGGESSAVGGCGASCACH